MQTVVIIFEKKEVLLIKHCYSEGDLGPREFVQVGLDDGKLKIEKIKDTCLKHFAPQTVKECSL